MNEDFLLQGRPLVGNSLIILQGKGLSTYPVILHKAQLWRFPKFPIKPQRPSLIRHWSLLSLITVAELVYFSILWDPSKPVTQFPVKVSVLNTNCLHPPRSFSWILLNAQNPELICPLLASSLAFTLHSCSLSTRFCLQAPSQAIFLIWNTLPLNLLQILVILQVSA